MGEQKDGSVCDGGEPDDVTGRLAMVAHELRGPLSTVDYSLVLLGSELRKAGAVSPPVQKLLDRLRRNTTRATRIVGDLLDLARFDLAEIPLRRTVVDLVALVEDVVASLDAQDRERVALFVPADEAMVSCDSDRVTQVLSNLMRNALQHGQGPVEIRLTLVEDGFRLAFENAADAAAASHLSALGAQVFRPFVTGTAQRHGLGLGLYVVHRLVQAHAGTTTFQASDGRVQVTVLLPSAPLSK